MDQTSHDWASGETLPDPVLGMQPAEDVWTLDMHIRLEALTQAVLATPLQEEFGITQARVLVAHQTVILNRAEKFEEYIRNGVIHHA